MDVRVDYKERWAPKNWCFGIVVLEKTLECPLDCKEIQPVHSKGDQPWVFLEGMMLKLKLQYFDHLTPRVDSLEKTLMLGGIEGRRGRGRPRMWWLDGIIDSMHVSLGELQEFVMDREAWRAVIHGVAKRRARLSDWTELNWTDLICLQFFAKWRNISRELVSKGEKKSYTYWMALCQSEKDSFLQFNETFLSGIYHFTCLTWFLISTNHVLLSILKQT